MVHIATVKVDCTSQMIPTDGDIQLPCLTLFKIRYGLVQSCCSSETFGKCILSSSVFTDCIDWSLLGLTISENVFIINMETATEASGLEIQTGLRVYIQ